MVSQSNHGDGILRQAQDDIKQAQGDGLFFGSLNFVHWQSIDTG
jgi:hypothetical protein